MSGSPKSSKAGSILDRSTEDTCKRLIDRATELFATRGLEGTTIRDLAEAAGVNVAAVHYHFGGKQELYAAVVRNVFSTTAQLRELLEDEIRSAKAAGSRFAAKESLRRCVGAYLSILFRDNRPSWSGIFLQRESIEPTGAMQEVLEKLARPAWEAFYALLELMRPDLAGSESIHFIASSIIGQCLYYQGNLALVLATHHITETSAPFLEKITSHITQFSLSAIVSSEREESRT
jgi:AcrR family transcriptional regulator